MRRRQEPEPRFWPPWWAWLASLAIFAGYLVLMPVIN